MGDQGLRPAEILLVEDNPDDVEITLRAFRKVRVANRVQVVRDGQEALDLLFRRGDHEGRTDVPQPDLVLLDLNLPKLNGLEVLEKIRSSDECSMIPVIMLTVSERQEDIQRSYDLGANTYITKPVDFAKFVRATEILGEYWLIIAKLPPKVGRGRAGPYEERHEGA
jgi:two-component system response regulator